MKKMLLFFIIFYVPVILTSEVTMQFGPRVYVYNQERISSNLIMAEVLQDFQDQEGVPGAGFEPASAVLRGR